MSTTLTDPATPARQPQNLGFVFRQKTNGGHYLKPLPGQTISATPASGVAGNDQAGPIRCQVYSVSKVTGEAPNTTVELTRHRNAVNAKQLEIVEVPESHLSDRTRYERIDNFYYDIMNYE